MRHQNFLGLDLVELGECAHRLTGAVHEGRWLQQPHAARLGNIAMKLRFLAKRGAKLACERIQPPEAGVVAGPLLFSTPFRRRVLGLVFLWPSLFFRIFFSSSMRWAGTASRRRPSRRPTPTTSRSRAQY